MKTENEKPKTDEAIIKLNDVRLSFPHLFKARAMEEGQEPKFGANFIMDNKKHATLIEQIRKTIDRIALDHFKKKVALKGICLHDGAEKGEKEGYGDDVHFISANRTTRPAVVNRDPSVPVTEADGIVYAGCYVNASVRLWVQDNKWGRRVNAELRAVQFVRDGESFGAGKVDAASEFEAIEGDDDVNKY